VIECPRLTWHKIILTVAVVLLGAESASALPIFARRYQTSCTTCHALIPKLNPFGIAFRNNGYRIPVNDAAFVQAQDLSLGAPPWKQLWPRAVWPGAIPNVPPIAVRVAADVEIKPSEPAHLNFNFPNNIGFYFAGPAGDTFSFFGHVLLFGATNTIILDRAYGQLRLLPDKPASNLLNLKFGRIDTRAEPFATYRKPTLSNFNVGDYRVLSDGFGFRDHDAGIELWGVRTGPDGHGGLEYSVGVTQGTGGRAENNNSKDFYWSGSYKLGGMGVAGSPTVDTILPSTNNYGEWSFTLGAFGYRGKKRTTVGFPAGAEDQFTRTGVKFDAYLADLNIFGAAVSGRDKIRSATGQDIKTTSFFAEADYMLLPWVMPSVRLERTNYSGGRRAERAVVAATNFAIRANVRAVIEGRFFGKDRPERNDGTIRIEFLF
jgi:hypothetical protein